MSRIDCFNCIDGKENKCENCNLYNISNNMKRIDIDKAVKKFCSSKSIGECDSICSFCFGPQIFKEGYNKALEDLKERSYL